MELLNEWVTPPILTIGQITTSLGTWSVNKFCDPTDSQEFEESDLLPTEKGHVYLSKNTADGYVQIFMPAKIMDEETGNLLRGLRSFKSVEPFILQDSSYFRYLKDKNKVLRNKRCCLQHFRLSQADYKKFVSKAEKIGALVATDEVNIEEMLCSIESTKESIQLVSDELAAIRELDPKENSELEEAIARLCEAERTIGRIASLNKSLSKKFDRLCSETGIESKRVFVGLAMEGLNQEFDVLKRTQLTRIRRELVHKFRVNTNSLSVEARPAHIRSLREEVGALAQYYPSLKHLTVDGKAILLKLGQVTIVMSATEVRIDGDLSGLTPYATSVSLETEVGARRRRRILPRENTGEG